ncbi:MAG TPA: alpha/beta fold hydrolase [Rhizomicrobium sp.]|jgi:esterase/lipase superfamily enzyme|nr:alpha/beta fold hydrolase [Rhizomicrobium sp.]
MAVTVYFATNRVVTGSPADYRSYGDGIVSPADPNQITYGTAFVNDANLTADTVGAITTIEQITKGHFSDQAGGDLSNPGRNLLVFIHGFDNSFENAITRAAFNQQWFLKSGAPGANMTVVAFSWPSLGKLLSLPIPWEDYLHDQTTAGQSGMHIMSFFANLEPIIKRVRATGRRIFLLAHSMGNWALQAGVESWFVHGNGTAQLFDEAILAAADERYDSFSFPSPGRLSDLRQLATRTSVYYSTADAVLGLSMAINLGAKRLGQEGPHDRFDPNLFPPAQYRMVDCSSFDDYDRDFQGSHQYYRRSPKARADIVSIM